MAPALLLALGVAVGPVRRVETPKPVVALTFDACATRSRAYSFDRAVYDVIKTEKVPATIFVSGRWVQRHPDAMREMIADGLVEFGNHSWDHPHMTDLPRRRVAREIRRTQVALQALGQRAVAFRPPFGEWNRRIVRAAAEQGLPTVTWDVVSADPSARRAETIVARVVGAARPGSIVVFHINGRPMKHARGGPRTAAALPVIVKALRGKGFDLVHLSSLLALGAS